MKWITPFAWVEDDGTLHLCCDRLLKECGLPVTDENLRDAERVLLQVIRERMPQTKVASFVENEIALRNLAKGAPPQ